MLEMFQICYIHRVISVHESKIMFLDSTINNELKNSSIVN